MVTIADKISSLAQKCDDSGLNVEAKILDSILYKIAAQAVTVHVRGDPAQNQWLATTNEPTPRVTVSSPIYNPADDRSPANYQRGIQAMRQMLQRELSKSYPAGTHFNVEPQGFAISAPAPAQSTSPVEFSMGPAVVTNVPK